jgi:hypothetical protein
MKPASEDPYQLYLGRFAAKVGDKVAVGEYGKHAGKLVKKLSPEEFAARWKEFVQLRANYELVLTEGHTISNVLMKAMRERAAELIVDSPG